MVRTDVTVQAGHTITADGARLPVPPPGRDVPRLPSPRSGFRASPLCVDDVLGQRVRLPVGVFGEVQRDVEAIFLDGFLESAQQRPLCSAAKRRHEAQKPEAVREDAWSYEQGASDQDHHTIDQRSGGQAPLSDLALDLPHDVEPLPPRQPRTHHAGDHDQRQCVERAEAAAQLDEQRELDCGKRDEEQEEAVLMPKDWAVKIPTTARPA